MKRLLCPLFAVALLSGTAHGADLGWNGGGNASNFYSGTSAFMWQGFYAGVNGGYGFGTAEFDPALGGASSENDTGGFQLGGQAGYNVDMGGFVLGAETDLQWTSIAFDEDVVGGTLTAGIDGYGTLRGRAGMTFDRVMPYVTGGLAYGWGSVKVEDGAGVTTSQTNMHTGWTVGAGLEAAATDNITFKAEFLYVDLGTQDYISAPGGTSDVNQRFSVVRAGINYKF
jgi:outer membrane immunogenic protein